MTGDLERSRRVRVDYETGDRFRIAVRQHTITVDQPASDGGEDTALTPTELFVASLGQSGLVRGLLRPPLRRPARHPDRGARRHRRVQHGLASGSGG